jgi:hypothetical protein
VRVCGACGIPWREPRVCPNACPDACYPANDRLAIIVNVVAVAEIAVGMYERGYSMDEIATRIRRRYDNTNFRDEDDNAK